MYVYEDSINNKVRIEKFFVTDVQSGPLLASIKTVYFIPSSIQSIHPQRILLRGQTAGTDLCLGMRVFTIY